MVKQRCFKRGFLVQKNILTFLPFMGNSKKYLQESLTDMEPTHRIRHNLDEAYCLLRQSEALIGDLRQTIEHSWRLFERSYTTLGKNKRSSEEPEPRNEDALRENRGNQKFS